MKLNTKMGTSEMILTIADGNHEALNCLIKLVQTRYGLLELLLLDTLEIYGDDIENLWKNHCNEYMPDFLALLREFRQGKYSKKEIHEKLLTENI